MKKCSRCLNIKHTTEFRYRNRAKGILQPWCKSCWAVYDQNRWKTRPDVRNAKAERQKARSERNARFVHEFLMDNPCVKCGEKDPVVLEFDHRDRSNKKYNVSEMIKGCFSIAAIKLEIEKCDVRCANCHRRKTAIELGWWVYMK